MLTEIMKWASVVALMVAVFGWHSSLNVRVLVQFIVCAAAALVFVQAMRASKRLWAAGFLGVAVLFNPVLPVAFSRSIFFAVDAICLAMFLFSVAFLASSPRLSAVSIRDPEPGNKSL